MERLLYIEWELKEVKRALEASSELAGYCLERRTPYLLIARSPAQAAARASDLPCFRILWELKAKPGKSIWQGGREVSFFCFVRCADPAAAAVLAKAFRQQRECAYWREKSGEDSLLFVPATHDELLTALRHHGERHRAQVAGGDCWEAEFVSSGVADWSSHFKNPDHACKDCTSSVRI